MVSGTRALPKQVVLKAEALGSRAAALKGSTPYAFTHMYEEFSQSSLSGPYGWVLDLEAEIWA